MLRKVTLLFCILFLAVMFANGMYALSYYGREDRYERLNAGERQAPGKVQMESSTSDSPPVNLLLLGLDEEGVRSDVILLVNYHPGRSQVNLLSVARDTRVFARGKYQKINALYSSGRERLVAGELRELTGLGVNYYITMNFKGFRKLVDTLDGVMFDVPFDMDYDDPEQNLHIHLNKGLQRLNGKKAEQLVRYRKGNRHNEGYIDGDIGRIGMQQAFIKEFLKQKLNLKYLSKADEIFNIFTEYFRTNIDIGDFTYYLPSLRNVRPENVRSFTLPGESAMKGGAWYFIADEDKTGELVESNFYK